MKKQFKILDVKELKNLKGGVTDSSPTDSLFCSYCMPKKQCATVFWCR